MDIQGQTAIVTGGAVRIGRALALALGRAGANVVVHYGSSAEAATETVEELTSLGIHATSVQADLRNPVDAAETIFAHARDAFGPVHILVNSAAIFEAARLAETTSELFARHVAINLQAPLFLAQRFAEQLPEDARGHIINIADWRASRPDPQYLAYTLTKSGLVAMTEALAKDLGPAIQVNAIAPGAVLPPPGGDREQFEQLAERNPLNRVGDAAAIADAMLYLLHSDFVTGHLLYVDGGEHCVR